MHFYNLIKQLSENKKTIIYVDMDGVIASYNFGKPLEFNNKRPLYTNINTLKEVSKLENVELRILSVCVFDRQINDKNNWLDIYAPFFEKDNRIIISKERNPRTSSKILKLNYLKSIRKDKQIILIDDDNEVLRTIRNGIKDIIIYQDSELID